MKFFWKLFLSITLSVLLSVCIGGSILIQVNFQSSLNREQENAQKEHDLVYQMLERKLVREPVSLFEDDTGDLEEQIKQGAITLAAQLKISGLQFQVIDKEGQVVYTSSEAQMENADLIVPGEQEYLSYVSCQEQEYYLVGLRLLTVGSEQYIVKTRHEITSVYENKSDQYYYFRIITLVIMSICYVTTFIISWLFIRPIRRLSNAAGAIAAGYYDIVIPVSGHDEISSLSRDFNRMAEKVKESIWEVDEYAERQQRFTDNFAHELKTPLTSMIGYADMIRSKRLSEEQTVLYADHIVREGKRLEAMSMKLMDLIVLRKQDFRLRKVYAGTFFESVEETVFPVLKKEEIEFRVKTEDALLFMEPDLLKTAVVNLIDNARKAITEHGIIELSGRLQGYTYQICVRDNGCGMEQSELEKVTEAFYMVDKSRSRASGGAGLGLAVCKEILDVHKGKLIINSRPGKGTAMTVVIGGEQIED